MQKEERGSISLSGRISKNNAFLLKKIISYTFSGFSVIFIVYLVINTLNNYPAMISGVSP